MEVIPFDIQHFFERYRDAFNRLDGQAVAKMYAVPSGITQDRKYTHWPAFEPIRDNMLALCELYRNRDYAGAAFQVNAYMQQGPDYAVVDLNWVIHWSNGDTPWTFGTTYNLVREKEDWRILLCTAYSEAALHST